jgi:RNA polymerase sigma factor (sigma-70 family)
MQVNLTNNQLPQWPAVVMNPFPDFKEKETDVQAEAEQLWTRDHPVLDAEQFSEAFRRCYPMTLRFLLSCGASTDTAEEVTQAAWVKGWECLNQLQRPHLIGAWVNSIAKNMLTNRMRSDQKREGLTESSRAAWPSLNAIDAKRVFTVCDNRDSRILHGYYIEGYTAEELAQRVGLTPVTVRVRLLRLRRALRTKLSKPMQREAA